MEMTEQQALKSHIEAVEYTVSHLEGAPVRGSQSMVIHLRALALLRNTLSALKNDASQAKTAPADTPGGDL